MKEEAAEKKSFDFVDAIRCISMMGIVFEHSGAVDAGRYSSVVDTAVESLLVQSFKFSTIAFFLIGGFLINHKFQEYTAGQYLKNRFRSTIKPWLLWLFIYIAWDVIEKVVVYLRGFNDEIAGNFFGYVWDKLVFGLFYTPSWFVLNFLICICVLLIFKKYLYSWWVGVFLFLCSMTYTLNVYQEWFVSNHSTALLGFVFYLWLGVLLNRYFDVVMAFIRKISWPVMILGVGLLFLLAVLETFKLRELGIKDAYNTLRVTNIFYSFGVFALLLKIGKIDFLQRTLEPRKTTYGIYLLHFLIIIRTLPMIFRPFDLDYESYSVWANSGLHVLRFVLVYGLSFGLVKIIQRTPLRWTVGN